MVSQVLGIIQGRKTARKGVFYNSWNRGWPEPYRNAALYKDDFKLVAVNADGQKPESFELYNLQTDPYERTNLRATQPAIAQALKAELDKVYQDIAASPHLVTRRISLGTTHESPTVLTRQDWGSDQ